MFINLNLNVDCTLPMPVGIYAIDAFEVMFRLPMMQLHHPKAWFDEVGII